MDVATAELFGHQFELSLDEFYANSMDFQFVTSGQNEVPMYSRSGDQIGQGKTFPTYSSFSETFSFPGRTLAAPCATTSPGFVSQATDFCDLDGCTSTTWVPAPQPRSDETESQQRRQSFSSLSSSDSPPPSVTSTSRYTADPATPNNVEYDSCNSPSSSVASTAINGPRTRSGRKSSWSYSKSQSVKQRQLQLETEERELVRKTTIVRRKCEQMRRYSALLEQRVDSWIASHQEPTSNRGLNDPLLGGRTDFA